MINILRGARQKLARLRPVRVPEAPARAFRDLWPGDAARGARLLRGEFETAGTARPLRIGLGGAEGWDVASGSPTWRAAAHGFAWMRDLRALGTDAARLHARALTADWLARGAEEAVADAPEVMGARLSAWLGHWDFFAATAEDQFRRAVMTRMAQDARDLSAALPAEAEHRGALAALKGAMAAAIALEEDAYLQRAARFLPAEIDRQFHPDGGHVERSPAMQLVALQDLIEIRNLMHGAGVEPPPHLAALLDRAAPALRLFRHGDGGLALFNGTRDESSALIDLVLTQGQARGPRADRTARDRFPAPAGRAHADHRRYRRAAGRACGRRRRGRRAARGRGPLRPCRHAGLRDVGRARPPDRELRRRAGAEEAWRDALRATAAHSTLTLSDTNSAELRPEASAAAPNRSRPHATNPPARSGWKQAMMAGAAPSARCIAAACTWPNPATTCAARTWWKSAAMAWCRPSRCASICIRAWWHRCCRTRARHSAPALGHRLEAARQGCARIARGERLYRRRAAPVATGGADGRGGRGVGAVGDHAGVDGRAW